MNPYAPPSVEESDLPLRPAIDYTWAFWIKLTAVVGVNAIVPLALAMLIATPDGMIGTVIGLIVIVLGCGFLGVRSPALKPVMIRGGIGLAVTQLFPIGQMFIGIVAILLCTKMNLGEGLDADDPRRAVSTILAGFVSTILTGSMLFVIVLLLGTLAHGWGRSTGRR